jgi:hypothetical protein
MGKLKIISVAILSMPFIVSCDEDVDNSITGEYNFKIVNGTSHKCEIEYHPFHKENDLKKNVISAGDSVVFHGDGGTGRNLENPFSDHQVYLIFDDTLKYSCWGNSGHAMLAATANYQATLVEEGHTDFRYVITEEDYEYAKAHPYKGE